MNGDPVDNPSLAFMEAVCISYFTIEYFLRLAGAPQKWEFIKQVMDLYIYFILYVQLLS